MNGGIFIKGGNQVFNEEIILWRSLFPQKEPRVFLKKRRNKIQLFSKDLN